MIIYKITNKINGKLYIGQSTRTLEERWKDYIKDFKYVTPGKKNYRPIIAALQKYGLENFQIELLEDGIQDKEILDALEIKYIREYDAANPELGYNVELGGNSVGKHSEATKLKISQAQLGDKNHMYGIKGKDNKSSKPIIDLTTGVIYDSVTIAVEQLGFDNKCLTKIAACARGAKTSAYGRIFRYVDENKKPIQVPIEYNIKTVTPIKELYTNTVYNSEVEAANDLGITKGYVSQILLGKISSSKYAFVKMPSKEIKVLKKCKVNNLVLDKYKYLITPCQDQDNQ